jgi:hypothetical protein
MNPSKERKCLACVSSGLIEHQNDAPICTSAHRLSEVLESKNEMPWPADASPLVPNKSLDSLFLPLASGGFAQAR